MRIYLVRHAESQANIDSTYLRTNADRHVEITPNGHDQARCAGDWLAEHLCSMAETEKVQLAIWRSEYRRAEQTCEIIIERIRQRLPAGLIPDARVNANLNELDLGKFAGYSMDIRSTFFPLESAEFDKQWDAGRGYYAKHPGGESHEDVALRLDRFTPELKRAAADGVTDAIVIGHGTAFRVYTQSLTGKSFDELLAEPRSGNCHIRLLEMDRRFIDRGYVYAMKHPSGD